MQLVAAPSIIEAIRPGVAASPVRFWPHTSVVGDVRGLAYTRAWLRSSRFRRRSDEPDRLGRDLHQLRSEPPSAFVRTLARRVEPETRWLRPRVRLVLVALLAAVVLVAGASANGLTVTKMAVTRTIHLAHHISGTATVKSTNAPRVAVRQTPAQAQYAVGSLIVNSRIVGARVTIDAQGVASAPVGTVVHDTVTV